MVASNSVKDLCKLMVTCKELWNAVNYKDVLYVCNLDEMHLMPWKPYDEEGRDDFFERLRISGNPELWFRFGLLNLQLYTPRSQIAKYNLYMASEGGHDASKYALTILNICGGKFLDYMIGTA